MSWGIRFFKPAACVVIVFGCKLFQDQALRKGGKEC